MAIRLTKQKSIVLIICALFSIEGCALLSPTKKAPTAQEKALDDHFFILTSEQRRTIKGLQSQEDIDKFLETFWQQRDPTPGTAENELKDEYYKRLEYARLHYVNSGVWRNLDDRLRVFLIYGPPDQIDYHPFVNTAINNIGAPMKDVEIWVYDRASDGAHTPTIFDNIYPGQQKFIFADRRGLGIYQQVYSTEQGEIIDPRAFLFNF